LIETVKPNPYVVLRATHTLFDHIFIAEYSRYLPEMEKINSELFVSELFTASALCCDVTGSLADVMADWLGDWALRWPIC